MSRGPGRLSGSDVVFAGVSVGVGLMGVGLWAGGQLASFLTGPGWASGTATSGIRAALSHHTDPGSVWASGMPVASAYWAI